MVAYSSLDGFIATGTLCILLSIFCTFAGANLSAEKRKLVEKTADIFTFVLLTDTFEMASVVFHIFTPAFIF